MKLELGKTYQNGYGVKVTIIEAPIEGKCYWFKGAVGNQPFSEDFPDYFHEDGSFRQFSDGDTQLNLKEDKEDD